VPPAPVARGSEHGRPAPGPCATHRGAANVPFFSVQKTIGFCPVSRAIQPVQARLRPVRCPRRASRRRAGARLAAWSWYSPTAALHNLHETHHAHDQLVAPSVTGPVPQFDRSWFPPAGDSVLPVGVSRAGPGRTLRPVKQPIAAINGPVTSPSSGPHPWASAWSSAGSPSPGQFSVRCARRRRLRVSHLVGTPQVQHVAARTAPGCARHPPVGMANLQRRRSRMRLVFAPADSVWRQS